MDPNQIEVIQFPDIHIPIRREPTQEIYLALQPPEAQPYVVAPLEMPAQDVAVFAQQRLDVLRELRTDMLKHFKKTRSLKCHFKTGDVAYLLGRPFMLRSNPLSSEKKTKKGTRGRANVRATLRSDFSVIDLFVIQAGNYEQGKAAFFGFAQSVFSHNIQSLLEQCMKRVFPNVPAAKNVKCRPMRDAWVRFEEERDTVWFSESLIPYPANAVVYAYLSEAIKRYAPEASDEERKELLSRGVPDWENMKALLNDANNQFAL